MAQIQRKSGLVRLILAVVMVGLAAGGIAVSGAMAGGGTLIYYGLGDSVASGYGLAGDDLKKCRRSPGAYPVVASSMLRDRASSYDTFLFKNFTCSGTESWEFFLQVDQVLADLDKAREAGPADAVVSATVGADLFGWSEIIEMRRVLCSPEDQFRQEIAQVAETALVNIREQVGRLLSRDNVYVILTDFYNPANKRSKYLQGFRAPGRYANKACRKLSVQQLYDRVEYAVQTINGALRQAVEAFPQDRARLAGVHDAFRGHEAPRPRCGSALPPERTSWIQTRECFHPNPVGVKVFAEAVVAEAVSLLVPENR